MKCDTQNEVHQSNEDRINAFETSGSSPPAGGNGSDGGDGSGKKSKAEIRAEQEFKALCKQMSAARKRRDTLRKQREVKELKEDLESTRAENIRLKKSVEAVSNCLVTAEQEIAELQQKLDAAHAEADQVLADQIDLKKGAEAMIFERDQQIADLKAKLANIQALLQGNVVGGQRGQG